MTCWCVMPDDGVALRNARMRWMMSLLGYGTHKSDRKYKG